MPLDLSSYKARVGEFYTRAFWLSNYKLSFITTHTILQFFVLFFRGHSGLPLALLLFLLPPSQLNLNLQADQKNLPHQIQSACRQCKPSITILSSGIPCPILAGCVLCLFPIQLLLHLAGDVHPNTGPKNASKITEISVIHFDIRSWANVCSPNILRTLRRTMIRFLTELLVRRIWFGQSKLYFILNWLVMRCKLRPELAADAQQTA